MIKKLYKIGMRVALLIILIVGSLSHEPEDLRDKIDDAILLKTSLR